MLYSIILILIFLKPYQMDTCVEQEEMLYNMPYYYAPLALLVTLSEFWAAGWVSVSLKLNKCQLPK